MKLHAVHLKRSGCPALQMAHFVRNRCHTIFKRCARPVRIRVELSHCDVGSTGHPFVAWWHSQLSNAIEWFWHSFSIKSVAPEAVEILVWYGLEDAVSSGSLVRFSVHTNSTKFGALLICGYAVSPDSRHWVNEGLWLQPLILTKSKSRQL
jgi:hypothetical protein